MLCKLRFTASSWGNSVRHQYFLSLSDVCMRGEAYLAAGQGSAAAAEFQKIIDHSGIVWNCWTGALAHLGVARANALQAKTSQGADADAARVRLSPLTRIFWRCGKTPTRICRC